MSTTIDSATPPAQPAPTEQRRLRTTTLVTLGALTILLLQLVIRSILGHNGYFSLDDFVFYTNASKSDLWDHDFLLTPYNGHLMPGAFAWVWISTKLAPLDFNVVFATMMALQLVAGLLMWRLLRLMFGNRPAILVPLAVFAFATITLPASWWWAAAINQQPQQITMILVLIFHMHFVRSGRWPWAIGAAISLAIGLVFFEKTAMVVPFVGLLTWFFLSEGGILGSLWTALRRYWVIWVAYLAALIPFSAYYVTHVPSQARAETTTESLVELFDSMVRQAVVPGLVGGPWRWSDTGVVDSNADPHPLAQLVAFAIVGAVIAASVMISRTALKAWALAAIYVAVLTVLLTVARGSVIGGIVIGSEYRYLTEFCLVVAVCGAMAFLPMTFSPWWRDDSKHAPTHDQIPQEIYGLQTSVLAGAAVVGLIVSSTYSAYLFSERWTDNPARTYVSNADRTMKDLGADDRIYNGVVPTKVVWKLLYPANLPTSILGPLGLKATPLKQGETTSKLKQFGANGTLEAARVTGVGTSRFDTKDCLIDVHSKPIVVPLTSVVFDWPWVLQIEYVAEGPGTLEIEAGPTKVTAPIGVGEKGPGGMQSVYAGVQGGYDSITLRAPDNGFCIKTLAIGAPQPNEW